MARKRASLKDKGPETFGLTPKKGKGIDVLFGGPTKPPIEDESITTAAEPPAAEDDLSALAEEIAMTRPPMTGAEDLSTLAQAMPAAPTPATLWPPASDSLPVNEADDDEFNVTSFEDVVDDLGLPMAMEAPPPDLELAMPVAEPAPQPVLVAPVAPVSEPISGAPASPPPMPTVVETAPAAAPPPSAAKPVVSAMPVGEVDEADDLSGLAAEDDLAGLAEEAETPAPTSTIPPANLPPAQPLPTAAPVSSPVSSGPTGGYSPRPISPSPPSYTAPTPATTYTARPSTLGRPPSTATGAPSLSMPRSKIESIGGMASQAMDIDARDLLPSDAAIPESDYILKVEQRAKVDEDAEKAREVTRYIGRDRRESLDREIERLYDIVANRLDRAEEVTAAFKILREAQDIIFEDARQYDEALYRVATVKAMLAHQQHLGRWSYTWGLFVFFYALTWLVAFVAGLLFRDQLGVLLGSSSEMVNVIKSGWFSAAAGGIGGVSGILYSLYWRVSHKRNFDPQYIMYYLTQPILGFVLGAVIYFIIAAGFLSFNREELLDSFVVIALYVLIGWIAGFRQRFVLEMVERIVRRILGKSNDLDQEQASVSGIPADEVARLQAPPEVEETVVVSSAES
ncbi:MAG: hypothetical protein JXM69_03705 [Anaerolineae bacterium]|nr:hypothetical protein [Anaerolineae bacterium]